MTLVLESLGEALRHLLAEDSRRVVLGEDVVTGGHVGLTRSIALDKELARRLVPTPLVPSTIFIHAGGIALAGGWPIVVLPSAAALVEGLAGLRELASLRATTRGQHGVPALILAPSGPGFGLGGDAAFCAQSLACQLAGLRVHELGDGTRAVQTLRAAASFEAGEDPTLLLLPRELLVAELGEEQAGMSGGGGSDEAVIPGSRVLREGSSLTVFTWGGAVHRTLRAVDAADSDVAVVELATLAPLDSDAIVTAASRTGRVIICHGDPGSSVANEVAALIADRCILSLDAPVLRVGPAPTHSSWERAQDEPSRESDVSPSVASIFAAILHHRNY